MSIPVLHFELGEHKNWKYSHCKIKEWYGASLCRRVTIDDPKVKRSVVTKKNMPTCPECLKLMETAQRGPTKFEIGEE